MKPLVERSGGQLVIDSLAQQGVRSISCVPGESFLPVLDAAIGSPIAIVPTRHEAGAGNMAVAHARWSGRVGVAAASRGPGAFHASIAVHTAQQDAVPMILLIGQVALRDRGRGGFQEVDFSNVFGSVAKWVVSLDSVDRIPETIARAVRIAEGGRPGPVVIEMPEDVLAQHARVPDVSRISDLSSAPTKERVDQIRDLLAKASKPIVILGRSNWNAETALLVEQFASNYDVPLLAGFRCQDYVDNTSPNYGGHLGFALDQTMRGYLDEADLVLSIGGHFGDVESQGYEIFSPRSSLKVIHVTETEADLDRYLPADLAVNARPIEFLRSMLQDVPAHCHRQHWVRAIREAEVTRSSPSSAKIDLLSEVMLWLREHLPPDAVIANGAGNYAVWVHRFLRYREYGTQLAPASGAMGFGLPAGIASALERPDRPTLVVAGDGCFTMALSELSMMIGSDADLTVVIVNNGMYGTIRMHQELAYPGRVSATSLQNPDFVALARAYGFQAARATTLEEFQENYKHFATLGGPRIIEVISDPELLSPDRNLP